ncbi:hypothetical protein GCM10022248_59520 [Nonomuraea soli]
MTGAAKPGFGEDGGRDAPPRERGETPRERRPEPVPELEPDERWGSSLRRPPPGVPEVVGEEDCAWS